MYDIKIINAKIRNSSELVNIGIISIRKLNLRLHLFYDDLDDDI